MTETQVTKTVSSQRVGGTNIKQETVASGEVMEQGEFTLAKLSQFVWYLAHFIAIILFLRFIFLLLGANMRGIVLFIYDVSNVFVLPFRGIFPSPRTGELYFDSAALLGIALYYLLAFLLAKALVLFSKNTEA
jgi:hypothetical protein